MGQPGAEPAQQLKERVSLILRPSQVMCVAVQVTIQKPEAGAVDCSARRGTKTRTGTNAHICSASPSVAGATIQVLVNVDMRPPAAIVLLVVETAGQCTKTDATTEPDREGDRSNAVFNLQFFCCTRRARRQCYNLLLPDQVRSDTVGDILSSLARAQTHAVATQQSTINARQEREKKKKTGAP